ncbi:MAG: outer membrane protein assembly factor BamD [Magnetospirillum sp.]|nr:outer membrane protein assembly factor BamD [Magnetospirillum sp.]
MRIVPSRRHRHFGAVLVAVLSLAACAEEKKDTYVERPVEELYNEAMDDIDNDEYTKAVKAFEEVERQHPYSVWATKAQLMGAYALYERNKYDDAIVALDRYIQLHPGNKDTPYAYYLKGLCYYEQIADVGRDQKMTEKAMKALQEVSDRFPNSKYARDARLKVDLARDHLAGKEMAIGRYYERNNAYLAALNRFKTVAEQYQTTTHVPEALHRMVEIYLILGLRDDAQRTAAVLGHNFPGSPWYEDSYSLIKTGRSMTNEEKADSWTNWVPGMGGSSAPAASDPKPAPKKDSSGWFDWIW